MEKYRLLIKRSAAGELGRIPKKELRLIVERIQGLGEDPRPHGCEKLSAQERYRVRHGDYRVIYSIDDAEWTVEIVKIGQRSKVYRK